MHGGTIMCSCRMAYAEPEADVGKPLHQADEGRRLCGVVQPGAPVLHVHLLHHLQGAGRSFRVLGGHCGYMGLHLGPPDAHTVAVRARLPQGIRTLRPDPMGGACVKTATGTPGLPSRAASNQSICAASMCTCATQPGGDLHEIMGSTCRVTSMG